jgi:hypothetical protein
MMLADGPKFVLLSIVDDDTVGESYTYSETKKC